MAQLRVCGVPLGKAVKKSGKNSQATRHEHQQEDVWSRVTSVGAADEESLFKRQLHGLNYTWVLHNKAGAVIDANRTLYNGCYGSLQRNESDYLFFASSLSLPSVLFPLATMSQQSACLLSTYRLMPNRLRQETEVLEFVHGFDDSVWLLTLSMLLMFLMMMNLLPRLVHSRHVRRKMRRRHEPCWFWLMAAQLKQACSLPLPRLLAKALTVVMLMQAFSFLIGLFLTSMIKTESVVYHKPPVVDSVQDVIDLNMRPILYGYDNSRRLMQRATRVSHEEAL